MGVYSTRRTFPSLKKRAAHPVYAGTGGASMLSGARQAGLIVVVIVVIVIVIVIVIAVIIVIIVVIVVAIRLAVVV